MNIIFWKLTYLSKRELKILGEKLWKFDFEVQRK